LEETNMRKSFALCAVVILALASNVFAMGEARLVGKVIDGATKAGIKDAVIHVSAVESKKFEQDYKAKSDGSYTILLLDGTIKYKFTYSASGYQTYEETMKLKLGETNTKDVVLRTGTASGAAQTEEKPAAPKADPAVTAYNDAAQLYNDGKLVEAAAKFEEAVKAKPELVAGWEALARVEARLKEWPKAINAATKALDLVPDETDMWSLLAEAYTATGDKAKAAEAKSKLPADASTIFNEAVKLLNAYKDSEAEPLLKKALIADDKFAPAHFQLGMVYLRANKMAEAKASLQRYLELEPNGRDAETAKETLKYLK
jgi:tetratricopeptide (TPR) repeat protein